MLNYFTPGVQVQEKGGLTSTKAKKILRDGTIRGHELTKKQKGFFGAIAGGNSQFAQVGGPINTNPLNVNKIKTYNSGTSIDNNKFAMDSGTNDLAYAADLINANVGSGLLPNKDPNFNSLQSSLNPQLYSYLFEFNQRSDLQGMSPQQRVQTFYDIPSNDNSIQAMKNRLKTLGYGPQEFYRTSQMPTPQPAQVVANRQMGGMTLNDPQLQAQGYNSPELQQYDNLQFPAQGTDQSRYFRPANVPVIAQDEAGNVAYLGPGSEGQYMQGDVNEYQMGKGGMMSKEHWNMLPAGLRKRIQNNFKKMGGWANGKAC